MSAAWTVPASSAASSSIIGQTERGNFVHLPVITLAREQITSASLVELSFLGNQVFLGIIALFLARPVALETRRTILKKYVLDVMKNSHIQSIGKQPTVRSSVELNIPTFHRLVHTVEKSSHIRALGLEISVLESVMVGLVQSGIIRDTTVRIGRSSEHSPLCAMVGPVLTAGRRKTSMFIT